jgi:hypothetical protein
MKPTFSLPQRKAVDAWVDRAGEREGPSEPKIKLARLTIDLNADLHAKFKAACAIGRTRMIDEVRGFIEEYTRKNS